MIIEIASWDSEWVTACNRQLEMTTNAPEYFVSSQVMGEGVAVWTLIHPDAPDTYLLVATDLAEALRNKVGVGWGRASGRHFYRYIDLKTWTKAEVGNLLMDLGCDAAEVAWLDRSLMAPPI